MDILHAMLERVGRYVTPLSKAINSSAGVAIATGNYVEFGGRRLLLTNEHVVVESLGAHLAHLPVPESSYVRCSLKITEPWPIDLAIASLGSGVDGSREPLKASHFDAEYAAVENEVLFFCGFPATSLARHDPISSQSTRKTFFGYLQAVGIYMMTCELKCTGRSIERFDPQYHFAIHYRDEALADSGHIRPLPHAAGLSGSLIWDTKYMACTSQGLEWSPDIARVCGLAWAVVDDPMVILCTKVEHIVGTISGMIAALDANPGP